MRRLGTAEADVLVVGGGATGVGVAYDLALRGVRVVLAERHSLASGATGAFHGLLHSGARYAVIDPAAAAECQTESLTLRRVAAAFIEDTGGFAVELPGDDPSYPQHFVNGCAAAGIDCREVSAAEALAAEPQLNPAIRQAFAVPDAAIDSVGVVIACARVATALGATILEHSAIEQFMLDGDRVGGAVLGDGAELRAAVTVNAAGAWAGRIGALAGCDVPVRPGKGVLVAAAPRLSQRVISRCRLPGDGDIAVPAGPLTVFGTSDVPIVDPDQTAATATERAAIVEAGAALLPAAGTACVVLAWAGVRPLFSEGGVTPGDREISRRHYLL
ncbi:MAG TPA: FAD-dependent oxidoreductase, partial [Actinomycetota bacterium]|nr:FAD-dependent oxidoreductase [Actinomycetota bacterium]